ncbi:GntR family transcriptional regulator [Brachybacterium sp. YJGR34]|uniref:GntR family transcriptional regulator n=1 Tax=Brachybacterium sp. YJGR34 TaxID=2059911 RepID=UPI000E0C6863|nr:GntR family transcriptional regulator [Brachybacterium sp. YJGR34]
MTAAELRPSARRPAAHRRIEAHLRALLEGAAPGDRMPGDRELSEQFAVSRMTARQAVATLVAEGRLHRIAGSGTFVSAHRVHRRSDRLLSFGEHMRRQGLAASARLLTAHLRPGTAEENRELGQERGAMVCEVERVLCGDGVPIARESCRIAGDCARVLETDLETGSLFTALDALGRGPARSMGTLRAASATADTARLLEVAVGQALLVQHLRLLDAEERPVLLSATSFVGERFVLDVDQLRHEYADPAERALEPSYEVRGLGT